MLPRKCRCCGRNTIDVGKITLKIYSGLRSQDDVKERLIERSLCQFCVEDIEEEIFSVINSYMGV